MNKKGFTLIELIGVVTLLSLIALVVYPSVTTVIKNSKESAYQDQIEIVIKAAKQWGIDHADELPDEDNVMSLSMETLLNGGYITNDDIIDPRETGTNLGGTIIIRYDSNQYLYEYSTETFKSAIATWLKENKASLLTDNIFKGTNPDNYVNFNNEKWRIMKINSDDTVKIIRNDILEQKAWDEDGSGYFNESSLNTYLNNTYYNKLKNSNYLAKTNYCTGTLGTNYCESSLQAYVGLISANEYVEASADSSCSLTSISTCGNSNYLKLSSNYYTLTRGDDSYDDVYFIKAGLLTNISTYSNDMTKAKSGIRPVVVLKASTKIVGGSGTSLDPFILSE